MEKRKRGGQPGNRNAAGHGAPLGNKNAVGHGAPIGNRNAEKYGFHSRILLPTPLDDIVAYIIIDSGEKLTLARFLQVRKELFNYIHER